MTNRQEAIRVEVERVCSSRGFENADRLKELLRYTVDKTLAGHGQDLKEYSLGVDVFGRGERFDPKSDSLVRVTTGKLRLKLKEYYVENPSSEIRIEYRSGSYAPEFLEQRKKRRWPLGIGVAAALLVAGGTAALILSPRKPSQKTLKRIAADVGTARDAAISPDGKFVAYVSNSGGDRSQLYVQMTAGGPPLKLPEIPGSAVSPSFSPDGREIVFVQGAAKSSADDGTSQPGVYITHLLGGSPIRIADGDANPHFSPDGQSIVYSKGINRIYLVSRKGGPPSQISPDHFQAANSPIFTSDGKHILFFGRPSGIDDRGRDWWIFSLADGTLAQTEVKKLVRESERLPDSPFYCYPSGWLEGKVLFWCDFGERSNLFAAPIDTARRKVTGPVERVTFGAGTHEQKPSASDSGRIVFTTSARSTDLHVLSVDPGANDLSQRQTRAITSHGADSMHHITVSRDGRMSYSVKALIREIWTRDLANGRQSKLRSGRVFRSAISPDGKEVVYHEPRDDGSRIVVTPFEGGVTRPVCDNCQLVQGWTPEGRRVLWGHDNYHGLYAVDIKTGSQEVWVDRKRSVQAGGFSPDGKWLSLSMLGFDGAASAGYAVPVHGGLPGPEEEWVLVRKGREQMQWSPDGRVLYYLSAEDGNLCLYGQRLHALTKRPVGGPFAVYHLHNVERSLFGTWMIPFNFAITPKNIYLTIVHHQSNIWMLD